MTPAEEATLFLAAAHWVMLRAIEQEGGAGPLAIPPGSSARSQALEALAALLRVAREVDPLSRGQITAPLMGPQGRLSARDQALSLQGPERATVVSAPPEMADQGRNR